MQRFYPFCSFLGHENDVIVSELAQARNGAMVSDVRDGSGSRRFDLHHAELVPIFHGHRSHRSSSHDHHVAQHHHEAQLELRTARGAV